jgi:hypothetical protein
MFVDATGLQGAERTKTIEKLVAETTNTWDMLMEGHSVQISKDGNGVVDIVQTRKGSKGYVRLQFTPTDLRTVEQIVAQSYFEALRLEIEKLGPGGRQFIRDTFGI